MGFWETLDSIGNNIGICYTDNERKRDEYEELYDDLKEQEEGFKNKLEVLKTKKINYESCDGVLSEVDIPSWMFEATRRKKDVELQILINYYNGKLDELQKAKTQAMSKWEHYKTQAKAEKKDG
ncbi:hypothetical protein HOO54_17330 [Bacillus sp. WMMC1349]|uniref:hypothetical protein n=1 Tax=Bacillus sp. WMMC1349 TaxID=2736254 RepID=UPI0015525911|nr:hypothetical protein [Bacillus sp. WMMC1349]NPC93928.1 hypothetical protein [Bacillus sp. WMMC1349]